MSIDVQKMATEFWENGYVIIPKLFSQHELDEFETSLASYIRDVVPRLREGDVYYEDTPSRTIKSLFHL